MLPSRLVERFLVIGADEQSPLLEFADNDPTSIRSRAACDAAEISVEYANGWSTDLVEDRSARSSSEHESHPLQGCSQATTGNLRLDRQPIVDILLVNHSLMEQAPDDFNVIRYSMAANKLSNLTHHGSLKGDQLFLCYRRGVDKMPICEIGVIYEGRENPLPGVNVLRRTHVGSSADINASYLSNHPIFITYRRMTHGELYWAGEPCAVVDIKFVTGNEVTRLPRSYVRVDRNLNKGVMSTEMYICYRKSLIDFHRIRCKPRVMFCYPPAMPTDNMDNIPSFCFPQGSFLQRTAVRNITKATTVSKHISTFVTKGFSDYKLYGVVLSFFEAVNDDKVTSELMEWLQRIPSLPRSSDMPQYVFASKCICVLSKFPLVDAFRSFLSILFAKTLSVVDPTETRLEAYMSHFVDCPITHLSNRLCFQYEYMVSVTLPDELLLGEVQSIGKIYDLCYKIGPENLLNIFATIILERKVLVYSLRTALLAGVVETLSRLIYPLCWQCAYIPVCPLDFADVLDSPVPYIIGINASYFDENNAPVDVICLDIDTSTIEWPSNGMTINWKTLPRKPAKHLKLQLAQVIAEGTLPDKGKSKRTKHEFVMREAFLRFMATILKDYNQFIHLSNEPAEGDEEVYSFDCPGYVTSQHIESREFYKALVCTQAFCGFIEESHHNPISIRHGFFDGYLSKIMDDFNGLPSMPTGLYLKESYNELNNIDGGCTVVMLPPESLDEMHCSTEGVMSTVNVRNLKLLKTVGLQSLRSLATVIRTSDIPQVWQSFFRSRANRFFDNETAQSVDCCPRLAISTMFSTVYTIWYFCLVMMIDEVKDSRRMSLLIRNSCSLFRQLAQLEFDGDKVACANLLMYLCNVCQEPCTAVRLWMIAKTNNLDMDHEFRTNYFQATTNVGWPKYYSHWRRVKRFLLGFAMFTGQLRQLRISDSSRSLKTGTPSSGETLNSGKPVHCDEWSVSMLSSVEVPSIGYSFETVAGKASQQNCSTNSLFEEAMDVDDATYSSPPPPVNRITEVTQCECCHEDPYCHIGPSLDQTQSGVVFSHYRPLEYEFCMMSYSLKPPVTGDNSDRLFESRPITINHLVQNGASSIRRHYDVSCHPLMKLHNEQSSADNDSPCFIPFLGYPDRVDLNERAKNFEKHRREERRVMWQPTPPVWSADGQPALSVSFTSIDEVDYSMDEDSNDDESSSVVVNVSMATSTVGATSVCSNAQPSARVHDRHAANISPLVGGYKHQCSLKRSSRCRHHDLRIFTESTLAGLNCTGVDDDFDSKAQLSDSWHLSPKKRYVEMCGMARCDTCGSSMFDEEVMGCWTSSWQHESDCAIRCIYCNRTVWPHIAFRETDSINNSQINEQQVGPIRFALDNNTVHCPYMNPFCLVKELGCILKTRDCLSSEYLRENHPTLFYNALWMFSRFGIEPFGSDMPCLLFSLLDDCGQNKDVFTQCYWNVGNTYPVDASSLSVPLYAIYSVIGEADESSSLLCSLDLSNISFVSSRLRAVARALRVGGMLHALCLLSKMRRDTMSRKRAAGLNMYRELLFLSLSLHRGLADTFDADRFDREYFAAVRRLNADFLLPCDVGLPMSTQSRCCRRHLRPLPLF